MDLNEELKYLEKKLSLLNFNYRNSGGIVTDKVIVVKSDINQSVFGGMIGTIDLLPQPSYQEYFLGQGRIDLPDREIRSILREIINELQDRIYRSEDLGIRFSDKDKELKELTITSNNYELATLKNGEIILSGD